MVEEWGYGVLRMWKGEQWVVRGVCFNGELSKEWEGRLLCSQVSRSQKFPDIILFYNICNNLNKFLNLVNIKIL